MWNKGFGPLQRAMADARERWWIINVVGPAGLEPAHPIDAATLEGQQKIADAFADLKLIPRPLKVTDAAWKVGE